MITPFVVGRRRPLQREVRAALMRAGFDVNAGSADLDLTDEEACRRALSCARASIVIDCSGADDEVQDTSPDALQRMLVGVETLARATAQASAHSVYVSSGSVFDGRSGGPHVESDPPVPRSAVGQAILRAEQIIAGLNSQHTIVRTAGLYGQGWLGPLEHLITQARGSDRLLVAPRPICPPTYAAHVAGVILRLVHHPSYGIIHRAATDACNELDLARAVVTTAGIPAVVEGIPHIHSTPPPSCLNSRRNELPAIPHWRIGLRAWAQEQDAAGRDKPPP